MKIKKNQKLLTRNNSTSNQIQKSISIIDQKENDDEIELNYKKLVSIIPSNVIGAVSECDDFSTHNDKYYVDFIFTRVWWK